MAIALVWVVALVLIALAFAAGRPRRRRPGPGAMGSMYDFLHEDKRKAIEIIVEGRAEERDEEHVEGNLPDLETPRR
jgi:hypothetical protein